jgi:hypothetical protein
MIVEEVVEGLGVGTECGRGQTLMLQWVGEE